MRRCKASTRVENVQGEFASTQDKVQTQDELYSYDFVHGYYDHMRYACGPNGLDIDLPQSMFDEWEFTVRRERERALHEEAARAGGRS